MARLSTAWAGQQPLALAQNRANALGLLGKEKCFSSCLTRERGTVYSFVITERITQLRECNRDQPAKGCETGHNRVPSYWKGSFIVFTVTRNH